MVVPERGTATIEPYFVAPVVPPPHVAERMADSAIVEVWRSSRAVRRTDITPSSAFVAAESEG